MSIEVGHIEALFRYPVKSMRGEAVDDVMLGWHGIEGDRRFALRRLDERGGSPWLTASKLPELVRFTPLRRDAAQGNALVTHVRTPEGEEYPILSDGLAMDVGRRHGAPVEMMHLRNGIFDDAGISVISSTTVGELARLAGHGADVRRFRPNILIRSTRAVPFEEEGWLGGILTFGAATDAPAVTVTLRDIRCVIVDIDPDDGTPGSGMLKTVARVNQAGAGMYGAVTRTGRLSVGQPVMLQR